MRKPHIINKQHRSRDSFDERTQRMEYETFSLNNAKGRRIRGEKKESSAQYGTVKSPLDFIDIPENPHAEVGITIALFLLAFGFELANHFSDWIILGSVIIFGHKAVKLVKKEKRRKEWMEYVRSRGEA